jgi:zinc-ribbon domain
MDKFCQKCGKQLQPDQGFCDQCGSPWTAPETVAASPAAVQYTAPAPPPVVVTRSSKLPIGIVAFLAIAAIAIGTWYFVTTATTATTVPAPPAGRRDLIFGKSRQSESLVAAVEDGGPADGREGTDEAGRVSVIR